MTHAISSEGVVRILNEEDFVDHEYPDQLGKPSIAYGHLKQPGEVFPARITKAEGMALFQRDLATFEAAVNHCITYPLTQRQYDVLVSLAFNIGASRFEHSKLRQKLNAGDIGTLSGDPRKLESYTGALREWAEFRMGEIDKVPTVLPVLVRRRAREIAVFLEENAHRDVKPENAPDLRDPNRSELANDDDPPPDAA